MLRDSRNPEPASGTQATSVDPSAPTLVRKDGLSPTPSGWEDLADEPTVDTAIAEEPRAGAWRYETRAMLGQGGMGQVHLCRDTLIGREVALKVMLPSLEKDPETRARFLREARVQGQLEHPAIVPVHEIGVSPEGATYFTMKRIRGMTLATVIEALAKGDVETAQRFTLRKLLAAFVSVCMAVDFAHERGVVHRDLKPGNIMLGSYGEVSVLDWGLAKPDADLGSTGRNTFPASRVTDESLGPLPAEARTATGTVMGTPGYMAPEYIMEGEATAQGDVFALGAILFEILAHEPLFRRASAQELIASTLNGADARVSARSPGRNVAPELEIICVRATARSPAERYRSARALSEAVDRFLEGDRDLGRRKELAQERAESAQATLGAAVQGGAAYEEARSRAMRDLGHALALDPDNAAARATMIRVLTEPPDEAPPEVLEAMEAGAQKTLRMGSALGGRVMLLWFAFLPLFWWMGMRDLVVIASILVPIGISAGLSILEARRAVLRVWVQYASMVCTTLAIAATSRIFGPFMLVPTLAATYAVSMQVHPRKRPRRIVIAFACLAMIVPVALEYLGVLPRMITFRDGEIAIKTVGSLREGPAVAFLATGAMAMAISACFFIARIRDALSRAEERLHLHAWHVQRMMPESVPRRNPLSLVSIPRAAHPVLK